MNGQVENPNKSKSAQNANHLIGTEKKENEIPYGYCHCGCNQKTKISPNMDRVKGWARGVPRTYCQGHHLGRGKNNPWWKGGQSIQDCGGVKYLRVMCPDHPEKNFNYTFEHILIAENTIGKHLPPQAVIHHVNGNGLDNSNDNLVVCENSSYHKLLHQRKRAYEACGHANWRKCKYCKQYDAPKNLYVRGKTANHRDCSNKYQSENRKRKQQQLEGIWIS